MPPGVKMIDGSMLEGGGQILRYSAALCAITGQAVGVERVRAKRTRPGLQPQHLTSLRLVEELCEGSLEGGAVGSSHVVLRPGAPRCGRYVADTKTAGSCTLMVQAAMPVCVFAQPPPPEASSSASASSPVSTHLELRGGTDADLAPPAGYLREVLVPLLGRLYGGLMGGLAVETVRRGFYPRGGGVVTAVIPALPPGVPLPAFDLTRRGNITQVTVKSFSAGRVPVTVASRLAAAAEAALRRTLRKLPNGAVGVPPILVEATVETAEAAFGDGCGVLVYADTDTGCRLGASAKGERGVPAEEVGERAAAELAEALEAGACVDQWMQDQLIIWMALGSGVSRLVCAEPTLHTRTAMVVAEQLLPGVKFTLTRPAGAAGTSGEEGRRGTSGAEEEEKGRGKKQEGGGGGAGQGLWLIECQGAGWTVGRTLETPEGKAGGSAER
ncbi:hypothetical protein CHLRE_01g053288v5 [Chlamydomonas reinhardtii]|uniref:RNA 3'-terminal-phosphate cyclase (ATP) n=1 Tax=Chlamydomonas reinhardtii TaxID=3055 RepID=A0A2K3E873_CHLRE|nr:uncharacterized protein CHLRE_01g053288v5 [Chlamydomonas reinhardtii]PNW88984.1 hypothetical protein CHLRE_01g053288v5 [Chlamydomonas reinhardtii]